MTILEFINSPLGRITINAAAIFLLFYLTPASFFALDPDVSVWMAKIGVSIMFSIPLQLSFCCMNRLLKSCGFFKPVDSSDDDSPVHEVLYRSTSASPDSTPQRRRMYKNESGEVIIVNQVSPFLDYSSPSAKSPELMVDSGDNYAHDMSYVSPNV